MVWVHPGFAKNLSGVDKVRTNFHNNIIMFSFTLILSQVCSRVSRGIRCDCLTDSWWNECFIFLCCKNFSVSISNIRNIDRYNPQKQKICGASIIFKCAKESQSQNVLRTTTIWGSSLYKVLDFLHNLHPAVFSTLCPNCFQYKLWPDRFCFF